MMSAYRPVRSPIVQPIFLEKDASGSERKSFLGGGVNVNIRSREWGCMVGL